MRDYSRFIRTPFITLRSKQCHFTLRVNTIFHRCILAWNNWKCPLSQNFCFLFWSYIQASFCEKKVSIWIKHDFFMNFKKPENPISCGWSARPKTRSISSGLWRRFRNAWLGISHSFYLCNFSLFAKFTEVKQTTWWSTPQLTPNQQKTGANGEPSGSKFEQYQ